MRKPANLQVSSGDRSCQNSITHTTMHKVELMIAELGLNIFDLDGFLNRNLHKMIEELQF